MPVVLTLDALTFAVSAVTLTAMQVPPAAAGRARPGLRETCATAWPRCAASRTCWS